MNPSDLILKEGLRLYKLGMAVHWIKPNSKAPVKGGWSGPKRDPWDELEAEFQEGYGLGVRLGESSKVGANFLANIDVDIKSQDPRHRKEAMAAVMSRFPQLKTAPVVKTGYGYRFFAVTEKPLASGKITASKEQTVVMMPTADISQQQLRAVSEGVMTQAQLDAGYRVRTAWEIEFMSSGKQVVLPPSIHPDTGKPYVWTRPLEGLEMPKIALGGAFLKSAGSKRTVVKGFELAPVDLVSSPLSDRVVGIILNGDGVTDRSAALLTVAMAMCSAKYSDDEILTVLTDRETFLGDTAYEHAQTGSRAVAGEWVRRYTLEKARAETAASKAFEDEAVVEVHLSPAEALVQQAELVPQKNWKERLQRVGKNGDGAPRETLENVITVLVNAVSPEIFKRDMFLNRDSYGSATPWGGVEGEALTDDDAVKIKFWMGQKYRFEPSCHVIFEAMVVIATRNAYHPVRDELAALPPWDGVPRIDGWLKAHFGARGPDEYLAQVFRKWLVASVSRTYQPGLKFDWMPIFEGKQGTGKSSFGAILFGQQYFTDWLPVLSDKDAALGLQGIRCVEFGELDQLRRNELETTKAFVTRQVDKVRPPYGRKQLEIYRQCVFFGTTNKERYLKDDTGNRRFNPVMVGWLDFKALARDRDQLWAEALWVYHNRFETTLELEDKARVFADQAQANKMVEDDSIIMVRALELHREKVENNVLVTAFNYSEFKMADVFGEGGPLEKYPGTSRNIQFATKALNAVGATRIHTKVGNRWNWSKVKGGLGF